MVPDWFSYVFTYTGDNHALSGFFDAIILVMESGFAVTALISIILNQLLPEESDLEEVQSLAGDLVADRQDEVRMEKGAEMDKGVDSEK